MPSKQIYVKPYEVKGHYRTIHTRTFKFICAHCDEEATRTTYATTCPKYCDKCKDLKKKLGKKKQTSGEVIITSADFQAIKTEANIQPTQQVHVELEPAKLIKYINQLLKNNYNKKLNSSEIEILIDLWNQKEYDEIAYDRNLKIQALIKISSNLMELLSNALGENIDEINFCEIIRKHCLADESLQTIA